MTKFDCAKCMKRCKAECCSIIPFKRNLYEKMKKLRTVKSEISNGEYIIPFTEDLTCPFLSDDLQCSIYKDRPDVCSKFGDESDIMLSCPYQNKDGVIRSRQERRSIEKDQKSGMIKILRRAKNWYHPNIKD